MIFCVKLKQNCYFQWQIQDFEGREANPLGEGINILFGKNFAENCMKLEEILPAGPLDSPMTFTGRRRKKIVTHDSIFNL